MEQESGVDLGTQYPGSVAVLHARDRGTDHGPARKSKYIDQQSGVSAASASELPHDGGSAANVASCWEKSGRAADQRFGAPLFVVPCKLELDMMGSHR